MVICNFDEFDLYIHNIAVNNIIENVLRVYSDLLKILLDALSNTRISHKWYNFGILILRYT